MKKIILCLFMILLLVGCAKDKTKNNDKIIDININDTEEQEISEGIVVKIDSFTYKDGYSTINLLITNNNDYVVYIGSYEVYVYDEENNLIGTFNPTFDSSINGGVTTNQMFGIQGDYRDAYRIEYKFNEIAQVDVKEDN